MAASVPILTFHALDDRDSASSVPPAVFRRGMARLCDLGYRAVALSEIADRLLQGTPLPERGFVLTFDDGFRSVYEEGFPVLQRHRLTATIFLCTGTHAPAEPIPSIDGRPMLTWPQIREMERAGVEFGAHTITHPDLTRLPAHRLEAEILGSKTIVEETLGTRVRAFAYPFGRRNPRILEIVRQHFACACSTRLDLVRATSDVHDLERVDAFYFRTERSFRLLSSPLLPWYLRVRRVPRRVRSLGSGHRS